MKTIKSRSTECRGGGVFHPHEKTAKTVKLRPPGLFAIPVTRHPAPRHPASVSASGAPVFALPSVSVPSRGSKTWAVARMSAVSSKRSSRDRVQWNSCTARGVGAGGGHRRRPHPTPPRLSPPCFRAAPCPLQASPASSCSRAATASSSFSGEPPPLRWLPAAPPVGTLPATWLRSRARYTCSGNMLQQTLHACILPLCTQICLPPQCTSPAAPHPLPQLPVPLLLRLPPDQHGAAAGGGGDPGTRPCLRLQVMVMIRVGRPDQDGAALPAHSACLLCTAVDVMYSAERLVPTLPCVFAAKVFCKLRVCNRTWPFQ